MRGNQKESRCRMGRNWTGTRRSGWRDEDGKVLTWSGTEGAPGPLGGVGWGGEGSVEGLRHEGITRGRGPTEAASSRPRETGGIPAQWR